MHSKCHTRKEKAAVKVVKVDAFYNLIMYLPKAKNPYSKISTLFQKLLSRSLE